MLFSKRSSLDWFSVLTGLFVGILLISEVAAVKVVSVGSLVVPGAVILFPFSYILGDVLTEVYGFSKSRQVIWTGFLMALVMVICFTVVSKLPAAPFWQDQRAWDTILGSTPRIIAASLIAYLVGEFSNSYVLARMKVTSHGKQLWKRTIGSTVIGEGLDTILFITIAFGGTMPLATLITIILSQYVVKVGIEIVMTPVTYRIVSHLKLVTGSDVYDSGSDFNPLHLSAK